MLGQRIVTALVLLAMLIPALWASVAWPFQALTLLLIAAAGWEWGRLNAAAGPLPLGFGALLVLLGVVSIALGWAAQAPPPLWWVPAAVWVVGGALALRVGPAHWPRVPRLLRWALGLAMLWLAWLAMVQSRAQGLNFLLSIFVLVWVADIGAYAGGRAFGRHKLAPSISPGKSWEGVASGLIAVGLLGLVWTVADQRLPVDSLSLFSRLADRFGVAGGWLATAALAGMSVVGDLVESLVKRAAGAKDSSSLLPGHGGVLDRVDALLPVLPMAAALAALGLGSR
ncbi:MAG: phosphatidate cytidylyltransferase [Rubrivivax sp.]|nr:phosphatidate cytidylyltransferase [Rubrivivax sp.]